MNQLVTIGGVTWGELPWAEKAPAPTQWTARVQRATCDLFDIPLAILKGPRGSASVSAARMASMVALRQLSGMSYPEIGRRYGGRDHTTAMHAVRQAERLAPQVAAIKARAQAMA